MFASTRYSRNGPNARRSRYCRPAQHALTRRVSPGGPSANLKDASLNPIKPFLVATTFAHHCPGPSSTATLARYRALPSGSSTIATTVSRGAVPACATHWTKTCGRSCGRRCSTTDDPVPAARLSGYPAAPRHDSSFNRAGTGDARATEPRPFEAAERIARRRQVPERSVAVIGGPDRVRAGTQAVSGHGRVKVGNQPRYAVSLLECRELEGARRVSRGAEGGVRARGIPILRRHGDHRARQGRAVAAA